MQAEKEKLNRKFTEIMNRLQGNGFQVAPDFYDIFEMSYNVGFADGAAKESKIESKQDEELSSPQRTR